MKPGNSMPGRRPHPPAVRPPAITQGTTLVRNRRRRPTGARRATLAAVALMLGGAGLVGANVYASATEGWGDGSGTDASGRVLSSGMATIDCPDVGGRLTAVP